MFTLVRLLCEEDLTNAIVGLTCHIQLLKTIVCGCFMIQGLLPIDVDSLHLLATIEIHSSISLGLLMGTMVLVGHTGLFIADEGATIGSIGDDLPDSGRVCMDHVSVLFDLLEALHDFMLPVILLFLLIIDLLRGLQRVGNRTDSLLADLLVVRLADILFSTDQIDDLLRLKVLLDKL